MHDSYSYIYGTHAVREALEYRPDVVRRVYFSHDYGEGTLKDLVREKKRERATFDPKNLPKGVPADAVHQGILAEIDTEKLMVSYEDFMGGLTVTPHTGLVLLGEVQDPQNVGSVIRSAAAFGVSGILMPEHRQAPITGSVIKVSVGMAFRIPLVSIGNVNHTVSDLKERGFWIYGLDETATQPLNTEKFEKASVFILGNEATGIRKKTLEHCDIPLMIPMHARTESLNAATAAAVVLYQWSVHHPEALG